MENQMPKKWEPIDFTVYLKFAIPWAILFAIIEILFRIFANWLGEGVLVDYKEHIAWVIRILAIIFISWKKIKVLGSNTVIAAISGLIFGTVIGFLPSLYLMFEGIKVWKFFNIFSKTVFLAVISAAIMLIVSAIYDKKINK